MFKDRDPSLLDLVTAMLLALYSYVYALLGCVESFKILISQNSSDFSQTGFWLLKFLLLLVLFIIGVFPIISLMWECIRGRSKGT